jgi:hypothetical protein
LLPGAEPAERLALEDVIGLWLLCALLVLLWRYWACNRQAMLTKKALGPKVSGGPGAVEEGAGWERTVTKTSRGLTKKGSGRGLSNDEGV